MGSMARSGSTRISIGHVGRMTVARVCVCLEGHEQHQHCVCMSVCACAYMSVYVYACVCVICLQACYKASTDLDPHGSAPSPKQDK
jgi:hypothetical protein